MKQNLIKITNPFLIFFIIAMSSSANTPPANTGKELVTTDDYFQMASDNQPDFWEDITRTLMR